MRRSSGSKQKQGKSSKPLKGNVKGKEVESEDSLDEIERNLANETHDQDIIPTSAVEPSLAKKT